MKKFDGILICTDLDGTLLKNDKTISKENLNAIEYFKAEGGLFTFITGRMPQTSKSICEILQPNIPYGCINGGGLYDYQNQKLIWSYPLDEKVIELVEYVDKNLPEIGIQINTKENIYFHNDNEGLRKFREITKTKFLHKNYKDVKEPILKILFSHIDTNKIEELRKLLNGHPMHKNYNLLRTADILYEIVPKEISKAVTIKKLCEIYDININKTIAIGDFDNDISMIKYAKIGVAVKNAADNVKEIADLITVTNEEHAIADIIFRLDSGEFKF